MSYAVAATVRPIALRAFTELRERPRPWKQWDDPVWPDSMVVFDTETTTDATQRLNFGGFGYYRREGGVYVPVQEGLFYADDLQDRDPEGYECLRRHCIAHHARTTPTGDPELYCLSRAEFVERILWRAGYRLRALIVGFNLPFDLTRIATYAGYGTGRNRKSFSLAFWGIPDETGRWRDVPERPRLRITMLDSKRTFFQFTRPKSLPEEDRIPPGKHEPEAGYSYKGRFADLRTLAFALTGQGHTLASACELFEVPEGKGCVEAHGIISPETIEYCRRDVRITAGLLHAIGEELDLTLD